MFAPHRPEAKAEPEDAKTLRLVVNEERPQPDPAIRDWSNVAFSVAFCEKARRDFESRQRA